MWFYSQPKDQPWSKFANNTASSWWNDKGLFHSILVIVAIYITQATDGYDKSLTGSIQSMPAYLATMGHPTSSGLGLINAAVPLGGLIASVPASYIEDWFGRRMGLLFGMILLLTGCVMQAAAMSVGVFAGGRVLAGAGIAAALTCAPVLCQEIAHPRMRGIVGSLYNVTFNFGAIIVTWLAYGTSRMASTDNWSWRIPTIVQIAPCLLVLVLIPWIPESPRWLVAKGQEEKAHAILAKFHSNGKMDDELVLFEFNEIKESIKMEQEHPSSWVYALSTPGNRKRFLLLTLVSIVTNWNGKAIATYYVSAALKLIGVTNTTQVNGYNAGLSIFNLVATIIGAGVCESWGRRRLWLTGFFVMLVANILQTSFSAAYAVHASYGMGVGSIFGLYLYSFGFDLACNPLLFTYEVEIMPYYLRSKGLAWGVTLNNAQGVAINYANSLGLANLGWKFYLVYLGLLLVFIVIIYLFFPETSGKTLEEVALIFDGEASFLQIRGKAEQDMVAGAGTGSSSAVAELPAEGSEGVEEKDEKFTEV